MKKNTGGGPTLPPIVLPNVSCGKCANEHPDRMMLNTQETAGYLRYTVTSIYSKKCRGELPPCVPGRDSPFWIPCDLARYLCPRPAAVLHDLVEEARKVEKSATNGSDKEALSFEIARLKFELRRSLKLKTR